MRAVSWLLVSVQRLQCRRETCGTRRLLLQRLLDVQVGLLLHVAVAAQAAAHC